MDRSIPLTASQRKTLLTCYRTSTDPAVGLEAHIVLLLAQWYAFVRALSLEPGNGETGSQRCRAGCCFFQEPPSQLSWHIHFHLRPSEKKTRRQPA